MFRLRVAFIVMLYALLLTSPVLGGNSAQASETLDVRKQAIVPIAAFTATGDIPELEAALESGLDKGLSINEIKEILIQAYAYAGFPRALNGINAYIRVIDKRKVAGISDKAGKEATPVPADFNRTAYGHQVRNTLVGRDISNRTTGYAAFVPTIDRFLVDHLFADIFYRDVLTHKDRELVTISMLSAMTGTEAQLRAHMNLSLNVGYSEAQLLDFVSLLRKDVNAQSAQRALAALQESTGNDAKDKEAASVSVLRNQSVTSAPADYFTGQARVESRFGSPAGEDYRGAMVRFEAGAHTAWHTHPQGQTLIIISGSGLVQSQGSDVQHISPGDVVNIPPNVRHWHGATPESPMSHIAISAPLQGKTVEWQEHVKDSQYPGTP